MQDLEQIEADSLLVSSVEQGEVLGRDSCSRMAQGLGEI